MRHGWGHVLRRYIFRSTEDYEKKYLGVCDQMMTFVGLQLMKSDEENKMMIKENMKEDRIRVRALPDENMSEDMKRQKERYKEKTTNNTMVFVDLTSTPLHFTE